MGGYSEAGSRPAACDSVDGGTAVTAMGGGSGPLPIHQGTLGQVQMSAADRGGSPASLGGARNRRKEMASRGAQGHARGGVEGHA